MPEKGRAMVGPYRREHHLEPFPGTDRSKNHRELKRTRGGGLVSAKLFQVSDRSVLKKGSHCFVPEQTALAGQVQMEINCLPVENVEYRSIMDQRSKQAMKPKRETKLLEGVLSGHGGNPGTLGPSGQFDGFIVSELRNIQ